MLILQPREIRKGFLYIIVGCGLLLHTLDIIPIGSNVFLVGFSLYLIVCGLIMTGYYDKIVALVNKNRKTDTPA